MNVDFATLTRRLSPTLRRITYKLNGHFTFFDDDDLFQEALKHLWVVFNNGGLADKTDSYVLQGCYFHLKNYIRKAMDKAKLVSLNAITDEDGHDLEELLSVADPRSEDTLVNSLIEESAAIKALSGREKKVMAMSLEGMTVREIGKRLGISHVMVVKIKKRVKDRCALLRNKYLGGYQN